MQCGARGLVLRRHSARELLEVLQTVAQGGSCFDEAANHRHRHRSDVRPNGRASVANTLTMRALEVFHLVSAAHSSREIALQLGLSVETIGSYRKSMMRKLAVNHVARLIQFGIEMRLTRWTRRTAGIHN